MSFTKQLILAVALFIALVLLVASCSGRTPSGRYAESWGQGYDNPQTGLYMQPDHGYWYYYMLSHMWMNQQPTYHIYVPPTGYPNSYRPWHNGTMVLPNSRSTLTYVPAGTPTSGTTLTSPRTSGGFSSDPFAKTPSPRNSGGFNTINKLDSPRTSGGFSRPPVPKFEQPAQSRPSSPKTSGGFSSSRPSGGSSPRSSGGFSSSSSGRRR